MLRIATCQFSECWFPRRNAAIIRRYMATAKRRRADIIHFHEGALSGYMGDIASKRYDWSALREQTELIMAEAKRLGLWVVLGSAHPLTPPHRPHNSLYLISPQGRIVDRYDKRFCMPAETDVYTPGDHFVTFKVKGVTCGLLICFDLRFPELYRELLKLGVQVLLQSFSNARTAGPGIHEHIMPQTMQARAASNGMWLSGANSSAYYSRYPSVLIRPDGCIEAKLSKNCAGIMVNAIDTSREFYDPAAEFRPLAMKGQLHSGKVVRDTRSRNRKSL